MKMVVVVAMATVVWRSHMISSICMLFCELIDARTNFYGAEVEAAHHVAGPKRLFNGRKIIFLELEKVSQ